ncbi:MAG: hypothetical protein ABI373_01450 [Flavobacteriales bacterium]
MKIRVLLPIVLLVVVVIGIMIYRAAEARPPSAAGRSADVKVTATSLFADFQQDEVNAGKRYNDKLVEVTGTVRSITAGSEGAEIILDSGDPMGAVVCDFKAGEKFDLSKGASARIQGYCAGYNMDVLLQRCSLSQ